MVSFLKGRRKTDDAVVAVDSSGAHITLALENLVARAEQAVEQLRALAPILERSEDLNALRERCEEVERQMAGMEATSARLGEAEAQLERVAGAGADLDKLRDRMGEFGDKIDAALKLREQIEGFLGLQGPIGAIRADAETLRTQLGEMGEDVTRMRTQADDALRAHRHSTSRLEAFDQEAQAATSRLRPWRCFCSSRSSSNCGYRPRLALTRNTRPFTSPTCTGCTRAVSNPRVASAASEEMPCVRPK